MISNRTNHARKFNGGGRRPDLRDLRRKEALERQALWQQLSLEDQLRALDARRGESKRQRERIQAKLDAMVQVPPQVKKPDPAKDRLSKSEMRRISDKMSNGGQKKMIRGTSNR